MPKKVAQMLKEGGRVKIWSMHKKTNTFRTFPMRRRLRQLCIEKLNMKLGNMINLAELYPKTF